MSRLSELYAAMETLRKEGLPVTEELETKANELEEEIIKKEILPVLTKTIEPALEQVKRELVLVVDYIPNQPLSVHLSRKRNFTAELKDAKEIVMDPEVEHAVREPYGTRNERGLATILSVFFPDGTVISELKATDTFYKSIIKIGVAVVREATVVENIKLCGVPLISNRKDSKYKQREVGEGLWLIMHSSNSEKKRLLERLSGVLGLGLKVELK